MAMKIGTENKRQVYLLSGLFVLILLIALYEIFGGSSKPAVKNTVPPPPANQTGTGRSAPRQQATAAAGASSPAAEKITGENINPELNLARLAESEAILYGGRGRNIFSADSVPIDEMEQPLASGRNTPEAGNTVVDNTPAIPQAPPIDLKYFGYTLTQDKTLRAFFSRGEDIFIARTGEVVDHRYKIGAITPNSVQVTDLSYNNTQPVAYSGDRN